MSAGPAERPRPAPADPEEAAYRFWRGLASRVAPGPALWGFGLTLAAATILLNAWHGPFERVLRAANVAVRGVDVFADTGPGAFLLRDYLSERSLAGQPEVVVLGASLAATSAESDPRRRLDQALAQALSARSGRPWRGFNLASNDYNLWSSFFVTRLLRLERRPDVLVVSLDLFGPSKANTGLVLAAGSRLRHFSSAELLPAIPLTDCRRPVHLLR